MYNDLWLAGLRIGHTCNLSIIDYSCLIQSMNNKTY